MKWWHRKQNGTDMSDADQAVRDAHDSTQRVESLTRTVLPGLRTLEAHRRDNHILNAMMNTIARRT